jgi:transposase
METPLDLYRASREEVIRLVVRQREQIAQLEQRLAQQETEQAALRATIVQMTERLGVLLADREPEPSAAAAAPTTRPGLKPPPRRPPPPRAPRKRRAQGYGRKRMTPTARQVHAFRHCPHCGTPMRGGTHRRRREVIEVVPARVEVTEHVYVERRCPRCRGRWQPGPALAGVVVGQRRLGHGVVSLMATLREEWRLPIRAIQAYLQTVVGLRLSVGAIVDVLRLVAERATPVVAQLGAAIRASPVLQVDETGWRQDGSNGYAWTFSTAQERLFQHGGRDRAMLEATVGSDYAGVLVSDFYAVYTGYDGRHQYCWAHLLRDVDDLVAQHRDDAALRGWADGVHALYERATAFTAPDPAMRRRQRLAYEAELGALCAPFRGDDHAPQRGLCDRIIRHLSALFVFVEDPAVPSTNNAAERSLRHLVTMRKISGGTRSAAGTATKMTLASLFGTWRLQGRNPLTECRALLASPQV